MREHKHEHVPAGSTLFIYIFIYLHIYSLTHLFIYSLTHLFIYLMHTAAKSPALYGAPIISKAALLAASRTTAAPPTSLSLLPVIVFSHGLAAMRTTYTGICCDLASHGYVVASVEHRYNLIHGHFSQPPWRHRNVLRFVTMVL